MSLRGVSRKVDAGGTSELSSRLFTGRDFFLVVNVCGKGPRKRRRPRGLLSIEVMSLVE